MPEAYDTWVDLARRRALFGDGRFEQKTPPDAIVAVLQALPSIPDYARRKAVLKSLRRMAKARREIHEALAQPAAADALCAALAAENVTKLAAYHRPAWLGEADWSTADAFGWDVIFYDYEDLLRRIAPAADEALRRVLAGPPLSSLGPYGAKVTAFAASSRSLRPDDAAWLATLAQAPKEPLRVREEAALAWVRLDAAAAAAPAADIALSFDPTKAWIAWGRRHESDAAFIADAAHNEALDAHLSADEDAENRAFVEGGAPLVPHLIAHLGDDDKRIHARARKLLRAIGAPTVEALAEVLRRAQHSPGILAAAANLLAEMNPTALRAATAEIDRALSPAESPHPDDERGLSRAAPD